MEISRLPPLTIEAQPLANKLAPKIPSATALRTNPFRSMILRRVILVLSVWQRAVDASCASRITSTISSQNHDVVVIRIDRTAGRGLTGERLGEIPDRGQLL